MTQLVGEFQIYPNLAAAQAWIDAETPEGTEPMVCTLEAERPVSWPGMKATDRSDLRMRVTSNHAAQLKDTGRWARTILFGFNGPTGRAFAGAVSFRPRPGEKPPAREPKTEKGRQEMMRLMNGEIPLPPVETAPEVEAEREAARVPKLGGVTYLSREQSEAMFPPPFPIETCKMKLDRMIIAHPDCVPVMLVVKGGKITMKRLA